MTEREIDIADMQCWVFRIAQTRWHISPIECAELFKKYDILGYISECYNLLCTYSYYHVVDDAELILASHNVFINDINSLKQTSHPYSTFLPLPCEMYPAITAQKCRGG